MSKSSKIQTRYGLFISTIRDSDYFHIRAHVVTIGSTAAERADIDAGRRPAPAVGYDKIRNPSAERYDRTALHLEHLIATCQGHAGRPEVYGFDVLYRDCGSVDRRDAEKMAGTLRTIERKLERLADKYGHPLTFGQYLARVAEAIGADSFVWQVDANARGSFYDDVDHRIVDVAAGIGYVDGLARAWGQEQTPAAAVDRATA